MHPQDAGILDTRGQARDLKQLAIVFKLNLEITKLCSELIVDNNINRNKAITKRFFIY